MGSALPTPVDLGLPSGTLWADRNLGSSSNFPQGYYFSWGNTDGHYFGDGSDFSQAVYNESPGHAISTNLPVENDAARLMLGGSWRIPTAVQMRELIDYCDYYMEVRDSRRVWVFISRVNRKMIEFFSGGTWFGTNLVTPNIVVNLWSRQYNNATLAGFMTMSSTSGAVVDYYNRFDGFNIRPVTVSPSRGGGDDRHDVPEDEDKKIEPEPKPEPDEEKKTVKKSRKKSAS